VLSWFVGVCYDEFAKELAADEEGAGNPKADPKAGLHFFGSEVCNMWVRDSDIDCNMWTRARIPAFFARLKKAIMAADETAKFEMIAGARVPVAKIRARALQFDVTHEHGEENAVAQHQRQVKQWAQKWSSEDPAISIAIRVIKLWAASKKLNNPSRATLNSLGFLVMLLALPEAHRGPGEQAAQSAGVSPGAKANGDDKDGRTHEHASALLEGTEEATHRAVQVSVRQLGPARTRTGTIG
jgi:DNA polymerase sigma